MKTFKWSGIEKGGKKVSGIITAHNCRFAQASLIQQGITTIQIRRQIHFNYWKNKISAADIDNFLKQFCNLVKANVPLLTSLTILANNSKKPALMFLLRNLQSSLQHGYSLSHALKKHPKYFNQLLCSLIYSGEQTGSLDLVLEHIIAYREKSRNLANTIKKAFYYPAIVLTITAVVSSILLVFVVPQFSTLFNDFGTSLPKFTQLVLKISDICKNHCLLISLLTFFVGIYLYILRNRAHNHPFLDKLILCAPFFGVLIQKSILARCSRTLAIMHNAGIPLLESLETLSKITNHCLYQEAFLLVKNRIVEGKSLSMSLKSSHLFPHLFIQMVAVGEESASLASMLNKIAELYESEVDELVSNLSQLLEPLVMAILGILIGGLVIAMYLPIFKMGTAI